jgi:hypothetical protein
MFLFRPCGSISNKFNPALVIELYEIFYQDDTWPPVTNRIAKGEIYHEGIPPPPFDRFGIPHRKSNAGEGGIQFQLSGLDDPSLLNDPISRNKSKGIK